jgi:two-component system, cell cycle sensor histidine kinase and response regulator CckA
LKCILLAEDDEAVRALLSRSLKKKGYTVVGVKTAAEALSVVTEQDVGVLITDVGLPDMSGPDMVEKCLADHPDLPVIFISGYGPEELQQRGFLGKGRFLQKPFDLNALKEMVAQALEET